MNPFTQSPVTHNAITWQELFTAEVQPFRVRLLPTDEGTVAILGMNGVIQQYCIHTQKSVPLVATGGQPTDLTVIESKQIIITDVSWNNLMAIQNATVQGLMDQDSGIHFPLSINYLNGYVYFSDQSGLYSFSSDGILQKLTEQSGITALTVAHKCIMMAVNGENVIKCLKPGFEPIIYCQGFYGSFRIVDMCTGPSDSLLVVIEGVNGDNTEANCGYLYVVSSFGLPTACVQLPGIPQSVCFVDGKILLALADTKTIYYIDQTALL